MKFNEYLNEKKKKKFDGKKTFTLDQINLALLKAGIGPGIVMKALNLLNAARGLGLVNASKEVDKN